jgi:CTP:molybdopterin cytidylyltransferase MocA
VRPPYEEEFGLAMKQLVRSLRIEPVPAIGPETQDVDTWDDLRRLREALGDR